MLLDPESSLCCFGVKIQLSASIVWLDTLNHVRHLYIIEGIFLNKATSGSLGMFLWIRHMRRDLPQQGERGKQEESFFEDSDSYLLSQSRLFASILRYFMDSLARQLWAA